MVIEMAGSSTVISGSGRGSSGSARVSPIVMSGMPATATMSPGPALDSAGLRSSASVTSSSVIFTFWIDAVAAHQATFWPLWSVPLKDAQQREAAEERRGVEVGDVGLQRGLVVVVSGPGSSRGSSRTAARGRPCRAACRSRAGSARPGPPWRRRRRREVEDRVLASRARRRRSRAGQQQVVGLVHDLGDARVGAVDLVDAQDDRQLARRAPCAARSGSAAAGPRRRRRAARRRRPWTGRARPRRRSRRGRGCRSR